MVVRDSYCAEAAAGEADVGEMALDRRKTARDGRVLPARAPLLWIPTIPPRGGTYVYRHRTVLTQDRPV